MGSIPLVTLLPANIEVLRILFSEVEDSSNMSVIELKSGRKLLLLLVGKGEAVKIGNGSTGLLLDSVDTLSFFSRDFKVTVGKMAVFSFSHIVLTDSGVLTLTTPSESS